MDNKEFIKLLKFKKFIKNHYNKKFHTIKYNHGYDLFFEYENNDNVIVHKERQSGLTTFNLMYLLYKTYKNNNLSVCIITPSDCHSSWYIKEMGEIDRGKIIVKKWIITGSKQVIKYNITRGRDFDVCLIEEAQLLDNLSEIYQTVKCKKLFLNYSNDPETYNYKDLIKDSNRKFIYKEDLDILN